MAKKAKKAVKRRVTILPKKLSSLIKIALADMAKAERNPKRFVVDMNTWFKPNASVHCAYEDTIVETHNYCVMCAAGSVMAFTLGGLKKRCAKDEEFVPTDFAQNDSQLEAINHLREGEVSSAASLLGLYDSERIVDYSHYDCEVPLYDRDDPKPFHKAMTKLQKDLEKDGL